MILDLWALLVIVADILLAIGAHTSNTGLMIFWLVVMMINIVLLFIGLFVLIIAAIIGAAWFGLAQASDLCNELENSGQELSFDTNKCNEFVEFGTGINGIIIAIGLVASILPIVSIYFWIVVNSLR